jgi:hypothetical protein
MSIKNAKEKAGDIEKGFCAVGNRGFRMTFKNGWSISVQWGPGNYISDRSRDLDGPQKNELWPSVNAEIAIFQPDGEWHRPEGEDWSDDVKGWVTPDEVLCYMNLIASKPPRGAA